MEPITKPACVVIGELKEEENGALEGSGRRGSN